MKNNEIHFLLDEITEKGIKELESLKFSLEHPLAGKNIKFLKSFTKQLVLAYKNQNHVVSIEKVKPKFNYVKSSMEVRNVQQIKPFIQQFVKPVIQEVMQVRPNIEPEIEIKPEIKQEYYNKQITPSVNIEERKEEIQPNMIKVEVVKVPLILDRETHEEIVNATIENGEYIVNQPSLQGREIDVLHMIKEKLENKEWVIAEKKKLMKYIKKFSRKVGIDFDEREYMKYKYYLIRDLLNLGHIEPLLHDKKILRIVCEGQGKNIFIYREGIKMKTNIIFNSNDELFYFMKDFAHKTHQKISVEDPVLDTVYKDFRFQGNFGNDIVPFKFVMSRLEG